MEDFVFLYPKIDLVSSKQTDVSSLQHGLARNPKVLSDNGHGSRKSKVLICNLYPLASTHKFMDFTFQ